MMGPEKKIELLAPAGNFEKLEIAVHYGADAVYLGGRDFSLRNFSGNFTPEEMSRAVDFAHGRGVKVYTAVNIYPRTHEEDPIAEFLDHLGRIQVDGVIVADPGVLSQARDRIPQVPLHLSTQANTTSRQSLRFWADQGVSRINLARGPATSPRIIGLTADNGAPIAAARADTRVIIETESPEAFAPNDIVYISAPASSEALEPPHERP